MHFANGTGIEMDNLVKRIHTCVSSTGTNDIYRLVGHCRERLLHALLNAPILLETLPAVETGSAILNCGGNSH